MPISYAQTPRDIAEERRLFYVAVTRARDSLDMSWARMRQSGARTQRKVSRFIGEMRGSQPVHREEEPRATSAGKSCRQCGRALTQPAERRMGRCAACAAPADSGLLQQLSQWRAAKAEELRVPEYMVLTGHAERACRSFSAQPGPAGSHSWSRLGQTRSVRG